MEGNSMVSGDIPRKKISFTESERILQSPGRLFLFRKEELHMPYFNAQSFGGDSSFFLRQSEGKVLGRMRSKVKVSTPQPGVKDYRFFVDPLSPLPPEFSEEMPYGFTGFMSRCGYGYNAFDTEEAALEQLQKDFGDSFITFTPAIRNNKFYVLDDIKKEGRTFYMDQDEDYIPLPAFGKNGQSVFNGDINKFCRHILTGKPIPGLSKKYWNNVWAPFFVAAGTDSYDGKLGEYIIFAPMEADSFDHGVIGEGGAYFHLRDGDRLGYKVISPDDYILGKHILCCKSGPLWYVPADNLEEFKQDLTPVPENGNILAAHGIAEEGLYFNDGEETISFEEYRPSFASLLADDKREEKTETGPAEKEEIKEETEKIETDKKEMILSEEKPFGEEDFLEQLSALASYKGLFYDEKDLVNFHISVKSSRLTILAGLSGTGKSGLVRLYGEALGLPSENISLIPVRPSWMDDGDILGYADMKNMIYRPADMGLADLLIKAEKDKDNLYIICFDEMNLARAEHYFAQFISVLEQENDPRIRLYNPSLQNRLYNSGDYPAEISIGKNIIFAGTVNIDESTYHFSDKILDRANVLTLHAGKFKDWIKAARGEKREIRKVTASEFFRFRKDGKIALTERELEFLDALNDAFQKSGIPCGIGFRVACQIDRYLKNIPLDYDFDREEGLDSQMVQRILTKIRGSSRQAGTLISLSDKGVPEGGLIRILDEFKDLSDFGETRKALADKARELDLYDYII